VRLKRKKNLIAQVLKLENGIKSVKTNGEELREEDKNKGEFYISARNIREKNILFFRENQVGLFLGVS